MLAPVVDQGYGDKAIEREAESFPGATAES